MRKFKYKSTYPEKIIEMFTEGKDRAHFCAEVGIAETTFSDWVIKYPEFAEAYEIAKAKAKAWFLNVAESHLVEHHEGSKLNTTLWSMIMRNRFEMTEHRKLKVKGLAQAKDAVSKMKVILEEVTAGRITTNEAQHLAKLIEVDAKVFETTELERRVSEIEKANQTGLTDDDFKEVKEF